MPVRQIAPVALVLALAVAGFFGARALGQREARRDSENRAQLAAAQIHGRVEQGSSLADSLRRFMVGVGGAGVKGDEFASNSARWLNTAGFPAAGWVEQVPASQRARYERRAGHRIVGQDRQGGIAPLGTRSSYLPATLVSGITPMAVPGIDLGGEVGMAAALERASTLYDAGATPLTTRRDGTKGLFIVRFAPRLTRGVVHPGFVVVFVPEVTLRAAATDTPVLQLTTTGSSTRGHEGGAGVHETFAEAGQRFDVEVPHTPTSGTAKALPWIILAAGLVLAALAGALGVHAARRARAQAELDRIFTLTPDLIAVADFDGYFTRVNPAVEGVLGYTEDEVLARPYLDFVHPEDRESTAAEAAAITEGKTTLSFENRFIGKDGSPRVLEWTSTPVVEDGTMYAVARDVTARRQAEAELRRLAQEQAALRRVATRVAEGVPPDETFEAVITEFGRLLPVDSATLGRFEDDGAAVTPIGFWSRSGEDIVPIGTRYTVERGSLSQLVLESRGPARVDDFADAPGSLGQVARRAGWRSAVGAPVIVDGRAWGLVGVGSTTDRTLPPDTEERLAAFAELLATAIANAQSGQDLYRLAEEQAALRRVATLVARGVPPAEVFTAIASEAGRLLDVDAMHMGRYDADGAISVAGWSRAGDHLPVGTRVELDGTNVASLVRRSGQPERIDGYSEETDTTADRLRQGMRVYSTVAVPIVVDDRPWGLMIASSKEAQPLPADTEARLLRFTALAEMAISNTEVRTELAASRARLVAAADEERRRVVRDLHDGAQQRLIHTVITMKMARQALAEGADVGPLLTEALEHAEQANVELRELAHGILPSVLVRGGLRAGVQALASRTPVPVDIDVSVGRLPPAVEATAYFVVAEALTNVAKHSRAKRARVTADVDDGELRVQVRDDGVGDARPDGSGLVGLADRLAALDGRFRAESPPGGGTLVYAAIPLGSG